MTTGKKWLLGCSIVVVVGILSVGVLGFAAYKWRALARADVGPMVTLRIEFPPASKDIDDLCDINAYLSEQFADKLTSRLSDRDVLDGALSPELPSELKKYFVLGTELNEDSLRERTERIQQVKSKYLGGKDSVGALEKLLVIKRPKNTPLVTMAVHLDDRQAAADLANSIADSFLVCFRHEQKQRVKRLLEDLRKNKAEKQLLLYEAERQLSIFKRENLELRPAQSNMSVDDALKMEMLQKLHAQYERQKQEMAKIDKDIEQARTAQDDRLNELIKTKMEIQLFLDEAARQFEVFKKEYGITTTPALNNVWTGSAASMEKLNELTDRYESLAVYMRLLDGDIERTLAIPIPDISDFNVSVASTARVAH